MEPQGPKSTPFPSHLVGTIVTDPFTVPDVENDPAYIFNVCVHNGILAATSSTNVVKIYDLNTHALVAQCAGHQSTITDAYFAPNGALFTTSLDGYVRMWDVKSGKCEQAFHADMELFSVHQGGAEGVALAAGGNAKVKVWDLRNGRQAAQYEESHTEDVTQVRFHPFNKNILFTASQDGLVCLFDISQKNEDDAFQSTLNVDQPINKIGFFGNQAQFLYVLTSSEEMQVWSVTEDRKLVDFGSDFRDRLSAQYQVPINYFIDCKYNHATDQLLLLAGSIEGGCYIFTVTENSTTPLAKLENGHTSIIRDLYLSMDGTVAVTGGEDSKISFWAGQPAHASPARTGRANGIKFGEAHPHRPY